MNGEKSGDYLLGSINATVQGTAEDVRAMRIEVGGLAHRVSSVEKELGEIQAERSVMAPDYKAFVHKTNNHIAGLMAWKSGADGERKGIALGGKLLWGICGLIPGGVIVLAFRLLFNA